VAVLEDEPLFRDMLAELLASDQMEVLAHEGSAEAFLAAVDAAPPDVAVLDLRLGRFGDGSEGLQTLRELCRRHPGVRALVLTGLQGAGLEARCLEAGAAAYGSKLEVGREALVAAVRALGRGEQRLPQRLEDLQRADAARRASAKPLVHLTPRELDVLRHVAVGMDNLKVAAHLGITERTVKAHVCSLYRKLGVENRAEMALKGRDLGLRAAAMQQHPSP
jgi:DNA-binding NarL/FixJ family response regulator